MTHEYINYATKYLNRIYFAIGVCIILVSLNLPKILYAHFSEKMMYGYEKELQIILNQIQCIGFTSGILVCALSFFFYFYPIKYFFCKIIPNTMLFISSIAFALIISEIILYNQYEDIHVGGANSPSHFTFYKKYYHYNKWGFRDKERELANISNNYRILVLGDSFTFGAGVKYIKDLYPAVLEEKLSTNVSDSCNGIEVINTGLKGLSTEQEYHYLKEKGILFNPDFLILGYVLNDAETQTTRKKTATNDRFNHLLPYPYGKLLNAYSFLYYLGEPRLRSLMNKMMSALLDSEAKPKTFDDYTGDIYSDDKFIAYRNLFDEFMEYSRSKELKMVVVLFPYMGSVRNHGNKSPPIISKIKEMVLENNMEFIDLLSPLRNSKIEHLTVSKTDGHPSKEVHHLAAGEIYKRLLTKNLIPCLNQ